MFSMWAVLVYVAAFAVPLFLLYRFHSQSWYWHVLAVAAALGMGFVQTPVEWKTPAFDLAFGGVFVLLLVWGIGGLLAFRWRHEKHA